MIAFSTLFLSVIVVGVVWGTAHLVNFSSVLTEDIQLEIISIITGVAFELVSIAFWVGLSLSLLSLILWFIKRFFLTNIKAKNKKIKKRREGLDQSEGSAFDSQFRKAVSQDDKTKYTIEGNNTKDNFEDINPHDNVNFNHDVVPDNFKKRYYDESMYIESEPDPDITNPGAEKGYDYIVPSQQSEADKPITRVGSSNDQRQTLSNRDAASYQNNNTAGYIPTEPVAPSVPTS